MTRMTITAAATNFTVLRHSVQARMVEASPAYIARLGWNRELVRAHQRHALRRTLAYAIERSPFHGRRLRLVDPGRFELADLARLPVMTKADMMACLDDVFTDRALNRALVEEALVATGAEPVPILSRYTALASGGSSGQRGVFVFDVEAIAAFFLSISRSLIARLRAQPVPPGGLSIAMVAAASAVHATGSASAWTAAGPLPFHFLPVPATLPLATVVGRLNELDAPALCGYPSMLARLAVEQRAGRLKISPFAVTTSGETAQPELRDAITQAFGVPVTDTFASSEGLVGTTAPGDDVLVFNTDLCIVELVDADNRPVPAGTPTAKVLVTNLYNRVQPLIRYELADTFVEEASDGHLRASVHGRADDVLTFGHVDIHPHVVRSVIVRLPEVLDYQVRQTTDGIDVDAVADGSVDTAELAGKLAAALAGAGLQGPRVSVRIVERLDRNAASGKLKRFVPLAPKASA
jgi:phenylacetate-CoA ligase